MAEELTSGTTTAPASAPPPGNTGQAAPTSPTTTATPQSSGAGSSAETVSTAAPTTATEKKVNLFELDDFKKYQAQTERTRRDAEQRYQQQLAQMQQQLRDLQTRDMSEAERAVYERDELQRTVAQMRQQQEYMQMYSQRQRDIQELAQISGAPVEELDKAANYAEAAVIAMRYQKQNFDTEISKRAEELVEKRQRNAVDLGGGATQNSTDMADGAVRDAWRSGDPLSFVRALRETRLSNTR